MHKRPSATPRPPAGQAPAARHTSLHALSATQHRRPRTFAVGQIGGTRQTLATSSIQGIKMKLSHWFKNRVPDHPPLSQVKAAGPPLSLCVVLNDGHMGGSGGVGIGPSISAASRGC